MQIALDTPLKFTAPGGWSYFSRAVQWPLPKDGQPGDWVPQIKSKPILCARGYHWCEARHALRYLSAECWLFEPAGKMVRGNDKCVSQGGRLLARVETWNERTARLFAADCAEAVVHLCGDDHRPRAAIETARRYARGEATREELAAAARGAWAARGAAWAAAEAAWAARATAWAARGAWAAARAACAAAEAVAEDTVWDAVRAAAEAAWAARGAACAAAEAVAEDTVWPAAEAAQTARLLQYLNGEVA